MNWFRKQKEEMIEIQVDDTERRIIVRALADLRDKQRMEHSAICVNGRSQFVPASAQ